MTCPNSGEQVNYLKKVLDPYGVSNKKYFLLKILVFSHDSGRDIKLLAYRFIYACYHDYDSWIITANGVYIYIFTLYNRSMVSRVRLAPQLSPITFTIFLVVRMHDINILLNIQELWIMDWSPSRHLKY